MKENNLLSRILRNLNLSGTGGFPRTPQAPVPVKPTRPGYAPKKILVVDDDLIIQRTLMHALEKNGYQVFTAEDISVALGIVRREKPDLILLDLTFPFNPSDMGGPLRDGFFMVEWLRRAAGVNRIPIMIISGSDSAKHDAQISTTDIIAYFRKPLDHQKLLVAIQSIFGKNRWD
jgi:DNA-binding response OmpR family regulator